MMRKEMVELFKRARQLHHDMYSLSYDITAEMKANKLTLEDAVDLVYAVKQTWKFVNDTRAVLNGLCNLAERYVCLLWVARNTDDNIKTEYCTGSPRPKTAAKIPKRKDDPARYLSLTRYLGIPDNLVGGSDVEEKEPDVEVVRIHWPGMVEHLTKLQAAGEPLPPGVEPNSELSVFSVYVYPKKGVDE